MGLIKIPNTMEAQDALDLLAEELLGKDWYIADPVTNLQGNPIIVDTILKKYSRRYRKQLKRERKRAVKKDRLMLEKSKINSKISKLNWEDNK